MRKRTFPHQYIPMNGLARGVMEKGEDLPCVLGRESYYIRADRSSRLKCEISLALNRGRES